MSRGLREALEESFDGMGDEAADLDEPKQEIINDDETLPEGDEEAAAKTEETGEDEGDQTLEEKSEGAKAEGDATSAESDPNADASSDPKKANDSIKAPASWKPKDREQWSKVPRDLQEVIQAREREISDTLTKTKAARDVSEYVEKMGQQYGSMLQTTGFKHPLEAANSALATMNNLVSGSSQQKAQQVAQLINQFGVDIETLDDMLVSNTSNGRKATDPQSARLEQMLEERLRPFNEMMTAQQRQQQQQAQQKQQQALTAVQQFANEAEFLDDVREDMADIIDLANRRGQELTLKQAYDRAVAGHPEISKIMEERRREEEITGQQSTIASKRAAASSVSGRRAGGGTGGNNASVRDALISAMDDLG